MSDDPPFLCIGTEVSAKFKGAFCEAKVKKLVKNIRCKVNLREHGSIFVDDKEIRGTIVLNGVVDVVQGKTVRNGTITQIKDLSQYTAVFNDGDERNLRRSQLVLKSGRHFEPAGTLDSLPLYNPEHFSNPVIHSKRKSRLSVERTSPRKRKSNNEEEEDEEKEKDKRKTRRAASVAVASFVEAKESTEEGAEESEESGTSESESDEEKEKEKSEQPKKKVDRKSVEPPPAKKRKNADESSKDGTPAPRKKQLEMEDDHDDENRAPSKEKDEKEDRCLERFEHTEEDKHRMRKVGAVVVVTTRTKRDGQSGKTWYPAVIVSHEAYTQHASIILPIPSDHFVAIRSIQNRSYSRLSLSSVQLFETFDPNEYDEIAGKVAKKAIDEATKWMNHKILPDGWECTHIYGDEEATTVEEELRKIKEEDLQKIAEAMRRIKAAGREMTDSEVDDSEEESEESSEDESSSEEEEEEEEEEVMEIEEEEEERKRIEEAERKNEEERKKKKREEEEVKRKMEEEKKRKNEEEEERRKKEEKKKKKEEEKRRMEEERKEKEKERDKEKEKEKDKEKERKKRKTTTEPPSSSSDSESSSEDEEFVEKMNQERDLFIAQLYKFHEERNTPINKAPAWNGKDLDLHHLYRLIVRYGGFKKVSDKNRWKNVISKLKMGDVNPQNLKKAYNRYLEDFHSTYVQLGWSLDLLCNKVVSGGRSAKKAVDYCLTKKRREPKDKTRREKEGSTLTDGTTGNLEEGDDVKRELDESLRATDASSVDTSRRSLSKSHSQSPMSGSKGKKGKRFVRDEDDAVSSSSGQPPSSSTSINISAALWSHASEEGDNHVPASILTHFFQGQSVRACHSGNWYVARVVDVTQPPLGNVLEAVHRAAGGRVKREPGEAVTLHSIDELKEIAKKIRCFVHYLGWNARYDEHLKLHQMRITPKDEETFLRNARLKLSEDVVTHVAKWSKSQEGMSELCGLSTGGADGSFPSTPASSQHASIGQLGGYRPRRVSFTQYEQSSAASPVEVSSSPVPSEKEKKERRSDERKTSEEKEERMVQRDIRKSATPVEKRERKKSAKKEEKEKEKEDTIERQEREKSRSKSRQTPGRTPSPSKLSISSPVIAPPPSSAPIASFAFPPPPPPPPPPPSFALASSYSFSQTPSSSSSLPVSHSIPAVPSTSTSSAAAGSATAAADATREEEEPKKVVCSISETIDQVVQQLGSRVEKEKREREERERREKEETERRREQELAAAAAIRAVVEKKAEEAAEGRPSSRSDRNKGEHAFASPVSSAEKKKKKHRKEEEKEQKEKEKEKKKGGKHKEGEFERKAMNKAAKESERLKEEKRKRKTEERDEEKEETVEDEEEEFVRLHREARALGIPLPDLSFSEPSVSGEAMKDGEEKKEDEEEKSPSVREDNEAEKYASDSSSKTVATVFEKATPAKGKKRKRKHNQSNMVVDRKYAKKSKKDEEDDSDEEEVPNDRPQHATLSVLKKTMLKSMEADGTVKDFSPIGLSHITDSNLYGEKVVCDWQLMEQHAGELREYYYGVRAELQKLEKRNKATIRRKMERDKADRDARRAAKEAAAAAAAAAETEAAASAAEAASDAGDATPPMGLELEI